jgi:hypothetical protein
VLAASVAELVEQIVWAGPALAVVGAALTVMFTFEMEAAQGALLIVHVSV